MEIFGLRAFIKKWVRNFVCAHILWFSVNVNKTLSSKLNETRLFNYSVGHKPRLFIQFLNKHSFEVILNPRSQLRARFVYIPQL